jgi:hypothetical protein
VSKSNKSHAQEDDQQGPQGEPWSADVMESAIADHPMVLAARLQRDASDPAEVFRTIVG